MRRQLWRSVSVFVAAFLALLVTSASAVSEAGVFEEEEQQEKNTAADSQATVPHTEQARKLAREVLAKMNESCYSLAQMDLEGVESTFAVERNGKPVGKMSLAWDRKKGGITTELEGKIPASRQQWLRNMVEWCMKVTILGWTPPEQKYPVYAAKVGDKYVLDGSEDPTVAARIMLISADYSRQADILQFDDGLTLHTEYDTEAADGKQFVKTAVRTASKPRAPEIKADFDFTYTHREGFVFIKRIAIDDIGPEGKFEWRLELEEVSFRRPSAPPAEEVPSTTEEEPEVPKVPAEEAPIEPEKQPEVSEPASKEALVIPEPPEGYVRGEWANAKVGTRLRIETFRPDPFGNVPVTLFVDVIKADEKTVTVKTMGMERGKVVREGQGVQQRFIPKEQFEKALKELGEKERDTTIEISGKKYKCEVYRKDARLDDGTDVQWRTYVCWEVPGWVIRRTSSKSGTLYEVADYTP